MPSSLQASSPFHPRPLPTIEGVGAMPWWAPLAGLTGAVAVFAGLALIDKIGAGPVNGLIIMANLLASLAIDHFGLMNMPVHALNVWRIIGGVLMAAGIILVSRF
jgi:transporter family-2 protein